jgi:hypothetical protein
MEQTNFRQVTKTINKGTFDTTSITTVVSGVAGQKIYVVAISIQNNETSATSDHDEFVRLISTAPAVDYYGGSSGAVYVQARSGKFELPMSVEAPWFEVDTGKGFRVYSPRGNRVSGAVWYYQE